jgi:hypothetical protein
MEIGQEENNLIFKTFTSNTIRARMRNKNSYRTCENVLTPVIQKLKSSQQLKKGIINYK